MADDNLARLRAEMDQAKEGVKEFAGSLWAFYSALLEEGFTAEQAFMLAMAFLTESLHGAHGGDGE